jgi:hypothetical protein
MSKFLFNYSEYKKRIKEADERSKKYFTSSIQNSKGGLNEKDIFRY